MKNFTTLTAVLCASLAFAACDSDDKLSEFESSARDICTWMSSCEVEFGISHHKSVEDCIAVFVENNNELSQCESVTINNYTCLSKLNCKKLEEIFNKVNAECVSDGEKDKACEDKILKAAGDDYCYEEMKAYSACIVENSLTK